MADEDGEDHVDELSRKSTLATLGGDNDGMDLADDKMDPRHSEGEEESSVPNLPPILAQEKADNVDLRPRRHSETLINETRLKNDRMGKMRSKKMRSKTRERVNLMRKIGACWRCALQRDNVSYYEGDCSAS